MNIYLDNAATTPMDERVFEAMIPFLKDHFGNPSSIHKHGRESRSAIEQSRKQIAELLGASPAEIFFTSGGTEADNTAIISAIETHELKHAITSSIEHHAVLHPLQHLEKAGKIKVSYVEIDKSGRVNLEHLKELLINNARSLVALMQANNEIGNLISLEEVGAVCREYNAVFHSDTVQTVAHYSHDLGSTPIESIAGSAHKFHGPKGIGFLYLKSGYKIAPYLHGGSQERNMRGGTENTASIVGLAKALEIAYDNLEKDQAYVSDLKSRMIQGLQENIKDVSFNGLSATDESLYTVLNVSLPPSTMNEMLIFNLDIEKISASGGSACTSGSQVGSHVLSALDADSERGYVRFSFSKYNTMEEIDTAVSVLSKLYKT